MRICDFCNNSQAYDLMSFQRDGDNYDICDKCKTCVIQSLEELKRETEQPATLTVADVKQGRA